MRTWTKFLMVGLVFVPAFVAVQAGCSKQVTVPRPTNVDQATKACEAQGSTLKSFKGSNNEYGSFDFECAPK